MSIFFKHHVGAQLFLDFGGILDFKFFGFRMFILYMLHANTYINHVCSKYISTEIDFGNE